MLFIAKAHFYYLCGKEAVNDAPPDYLIHMSGVNVECYLHPGTMSYIHLIVRNELRAHRINCCLFVFLYV